MVCLLSQKHSGHNISMQVVWALASSIKSELVDNRNVDSLLSLFQL